MLKDRTGNDNVNDIHKIKLFPICKICIPFSDSLLADINVSVYLEDSVIEIWNEQCDCK